jgi:DNA-binding phage protein
MGRKSLFKTLPPELVQKFHQLLSDDKYTQKQIVDFLNDYLRELGKQPVITERVVQRQAKNYQEQLAQTGERLRRERQLSKDMMAQIGCEPNEAQSQLLSVLLQSIITRVTMEMSEDEELPAPKQIRELAQSKKIIDESNRVVDQLIKRAEEKVKAEMLEAMSLSAKKAGVSNETMAKIRSELGIGDG